MYLHCKKSGNLVKITLRHCDFISALHLPNWYFLYSLGENGHGTTVLKDDFQANWRPIQTVTDDLNYRSYYGNIHYFQILERDHPLVMRKGVQYRLAFSFEPDIKFVDE